MIKLNSSELKKFAGLRNFDKFLKHEMIEATKDAGQAVQNKTKQEIRKGSPRSGRTRRRGGRSSARGEYPKGDTGTLGRSIMARHVNNLHITVGSHLKYAQILESDRLDRKHVTRAGQEMEGFIRALARQAVENSARKSGR